MNDAQSMTPEIPGDVGLVEYHDFLCEQPFTFDCGKTLPGFVLRYETYGHLNREKNNAVLICHALSGDHHCAGIHSLKDRKPGWWDNLIGPGKSIDTNRYFVICSNVLGGCQGSSGPSSINSQTGEPYFLDFPEVSIADMVRAQYLLLTQQFELSELHAAVGGSMGGMQVLQWGIAYPGFAKRIIGLATTGRQYAQTIAFNDVGRCAIMQDPNWNEGRYEAGKGPDVGLAVARMMAHITYLSDKGMENKFGRQRKASDQGNPFAAEFEVENYLRYQGKSFISRFDANSYLYITKALDHFDLYGESGQMEDSLCAMESRVLIVGFTSDWLYPPEQNRDIVHALLRCGKDATYAQLNMDLGHDSFLLHAPELYQLIENFIND
ncbi:MAG: homoserine O-acetyltransferase [Opitutales bacterium]|nr:homoserine O-acetyltransferase [Opitutales bacterium]